MHCGKSLIKLKPLIFFCLILILAPYSVAGARPIDEVRKSQVYKKVIGKPPNKRNLVPRLYTEEWFDPGTFYGQSFLKEEGYLLYFDWLNLPHGKYGVVDTKVDKRNEFMAITRRYLDPEVKEIKLNVLAPHPRSIKPVKLGLVLDFTKEIPSPKQIHSTENLDFAGKVATFYNLNDGSCKIVFQSSQGTIVSASVELIALKANLLNFFKDLDLQLFDQRIQS